MNILFPDNQQNTQNIQLEINKLRNQGFFEERGGSSIQFKYIQPSQFTFERFRDLQDQEIQFEGFSVYLRMLTTTYNTGDVTTGVRGDTREEENPTPPPDTITVNVKWNEFASIVRTKVDTLEVIVLAPYQPTSKELDLFAADANVLEVFGAAFLLGSYDNNEDWINTTPIEKDPIYMTQNWSNDGEVFDFLHAQRIVINWYTNEQIDSGMNPQDFWDSLSDQMKTESIRWGVLPNGTFGGNNIVAHISSKRERGQLRKWHQDKLAEARRRRFQDGWVTLKDNFKQAAIDSYINDYWTTRYMQHYIHQGGGTDAADLVTSGAINSAFTTQWQSGDVLYSDQTVGTIENILIRVLDADRY